MKFLLGTKQGMSQIFKEDGTVVPVTVIRAEPNTVTALKHAEKDGYVAVQLGFGKKSKNKVRKPQQGQWKDLGVFRWVREFRVESAEGFERGKKLDVSLFEPGENIQVTGMSKGKGFAGVVKRHHFKGGPASHGHKDNLRAPGSIGATFPQHVIKGMRMAGHMGDERVTVKNLKIVSIKPETNELVVSGAVPGARNGLILIETL
jgi:large subunit ribosomal protein L3